MTESMHSASIWKNAWSVRIIVLICIVLFVGIGSQALLNAFATGTTTNMMLKVTAYSQDGRMGDGRWTYFGACAVSSAQFPFGTIIDLYDQHGYFTLECIAEDTGKGLGNGHISLAMPGDAYSALHWGTRTFIAQIARWGWGSEKPPSPLSTWTPTPVKQQPPVHHLRGHLDVLKP